MRIHVCLATTLLLAGAVLADEPSPAIHAGYGDLQEAHAINGDLLRSNRQFFVKVSYAFQQ